jgi:hypothetical protein
MPKARTTRAIGRKRRTLGWVLLTLGVLVAGVWVASRWWIACWVCPGGHTTCWISSGHLATTSYRLSYTQPGWKYIAPASPAQQGQWTLWHGWGSRTIVVNFTQRDFGILSTNHYVVAGETQSRDFRLVLWPIPLLLWTPAALLLRSGILARRRANKGACPRCGYSLTGLAEGAPCPECGQGAT